MTSEPLIIISDLPRWRGFHSTLDCHYDCVLVWPYLVELAGYHPPGVDSNPRASPFRSSDVLGNSWHLQIAETVRLLERARR